MPDANDWLAHAIFGRDGFDERGKLLPDSDDEDDGEWNVKKRRYVKTKSQLLETQPALLALRGRRPDEVQGQELVAYYDADGTGVIVGCDAMAQSYDEQGLWVVGVGGKYHGRVELEGLSAIIQSAGLLRESHAAALPTVPCPSPSRSSAATAPPDGRLRVIDCAAHEAVSAVGLAVAPQPAAPRGRCAASISRNRTPHTLFRMYEMDRGVSRRTRGLGCLARRGRLRDELMRAMCTVQLSNLRIGSAPTSEPPDGS
eukprot:794777-Prymnesium_polylepis.1